MAKKTSTPSKSSEKITRVLFLDFDGVLCTDRVHYANYSDKIFPREYMRSLDPIGIKLVNRLCDDFDLTVVLCTTWRHQNDCKVILRTHGFTAPFHHDINTPNEATFSSPGRKGAEINSWLDEHPEVKTYIILDDDETILHFDHIVYPHPLDGISTENYLDATRLLQMQIAKEQQ